MATASVLDAHDDLTLRTDQASPSKAAVSFRSWQVFGLVGKQRCSSAGLLSAASQSYDQCLRQNSFPLTAAGQSPNSTGFPFQSHTLPCVAHQAETHPMGFTEASQSISCGLPVDFEENSKWERPGNCSELPMNQRGRYSVLINIYL